MNTTPTPPKKTVSPPLRRLVRELKSFYKQHGRGHLPWRKTRDPYKILVSEVMLQQTQVDRVVPYYTAFIKKFPTPQALARARLPEVLRAWQGLGYNRRAKYLHEAAKVLAKEQFAGQRLPGVGPYTRGAVLAFALNRSEVFVETNIRTVIFYHLGKGKVMSDAELLPIVGGLLATAKMHPREFYAAMMDYGAHLKRRGIKLNARSKHYAKQSAFKGSARQLRGAIVRQLLESPATRAQLIKNLRRSAGEVDRELERLGKEKLIKRRGRLWTIA